MLDLFLLPMAVLYLLVIGMLFIYGVNFLYLTFLAWRIARQDEQVPQEHSSLTEWPKVTVQLPIYNELYVANRLIEAAACLDYPSHLLQIQVLDDSTDETTEIIELAVARARARGVNIVHLHRTNRTGFKAGALDAGLAGAHGEFIAIFDADFVPQPHFLKQTLATFEESRVAFVQTRWGHLNPDYSFLTFLQSLAIDGHFMIEQFARSRGGYWFNFNGTAGVWRRTALYDAGGWTADTLTEDLDLSYRAYLRGWKGQYLRDVEVRAELPVNFSAYRRQQHRWARGSLECALKLSAQIWQAAIPLKHKVQATLHLTGYGVHLLLFALTLLYPFVLLLSQQYADWVVLFGLAYFFNLTALAPSIFFTVGQQQLGRRWWLLLPKILFIMVLGSGLMLNTVRAALQILFKSKTVFERTAKFGIEEKKQDWTRKRYQLRLDPIVYLELLLALYNFVTLWLAIRLANWAIAFYATLFGTGLLFVAMMSIIQAIAVYRNRNKPKITAVFEPESELV